MKGALIAIAIAALGHQTPPSPSQQARDKARAPVMGNAVIGGRVTADEPGGAPVRRVLVRLTGSSVDTTQAPSVNRLALTDDEGRYVIPNLPEGRFYIAAEKGGWVTLRYGSQSAFDSGVQVAVANGQSAVVDLKLTRGAVIAGRVVDEHGQPQAGIRPTLLEYRTINGERRLTRAPLLGAGSASVQTNDLGEYRFFGVSPGSYVVAIQSGFSGLGIGTAVRTTTDEEIAWARQPASPATAVQGGGTPAPQPGRGVVMAPVYHPGVTDASAATTITVASGEQRLDVDFVTAFVPTAQVRGMVIRPDGQPAAGARVQLSRARSAMSPLDTAFSSATVDAKGAFAFGSVASGEFVINARASSQAAPAPSAPGAPKPAPAAQVLDLWGTAPITVSGRDLTGISLTLQPGITVTGRIAFESASGTAAPAPSNVRLTMYSSNVFEVGAGPVSISNMSMSSASAEGTFAFQGLTPGRYVLSANVGGLGSSWMQKALTISGRNVSDNGLEIRAGEDLSEVVVVLTDQVSEVTGTLLHADGTPAPEFHVFVFPTDKSKWSAAAQRLRPPVRPASDGRYRVTSMHAGEYYVAALSRFDPNNLFDTAFLEQVAAAAFKITLAEGEKKVQDLKTR